MTFKNGLDGLILATLSDGPMHGYLVSKAIKGKSDGVFKLGEGQLYPTLHRLERDGFISSTWEQQEAKPPRKVYEITPAGKEELARHQKTWAKFSSGVSSVLMGSVVKGGSNG